MTILPAYIQELDFEDCLEHNKAIKRIGDRNLLEFAAILSKEEDSDSYLTSPTYYTFTGRRGLWLYTYNKTYVPFCWHPNIDGQILIFPPRGQKDHAAVMALLGELPPPPVGCVLGRVKPKDVVRATTASTFAADIALAPGMEEVLDWRYPVHILSTEKVSQMAGGGYMKTRNHVRQMEKHRVRVEKLLPSHSFAIENLAYRWANLRSDNADELIDLIGPYKHILHLVKYKALNLDGLVFRIDEHVQAAIAWDISNAKTHTANVYLNLCNTSYRGLSEFVVKTAAEFLHEKGFRHMNLGGSETKGLDDYKKKFMPDCSIDLCSIQVMNNTSYRLPSFQTNREIMAA